MNTVYNISVAIALIVAVVFSLLVLLTGKGDAMSGGTSVRTTFKGKASFDDYMSKATLVLGVSFLVLMVVIDAISNRLSSTP